MARGLVACYSLDFGLGWHALSLRRACRPPTACTPFASCSGRATRKRSRDKALGRRRQTRFVSSQIRRRPAEAGVLVSADQTQQGLGIGRLGEEIVEADLLGAAPVLVT